MGQAALPESEKPDKVDGKVGHSISDCWRRVTSRTPPPSDLETRVSDAYQLLIYGIERGKDIAPEIRSSILKAKEGVEQKRVWSVPEKDEFLAAYAKLAAMMWEVTAVTLQASDRRYGLFTRARVQSILFGLLALVLLIFIGLGEWTRTFIAVIPETQKELLTVTADLRTVELGRKARERQLAALDAKPKGDTDGALREPIIGQLDELNQRRDTLMARQDELNRKLRAAYGRLPRGVSDAVIITSVGAIFGGFLLPILYGALGTCAYVLRTIYGKMVDNCFDPSHLGEFLVRLFLGTLSGVAMQWFFVGDSKQIPGGVTPAVLAFVGGYSVELLFTAIDRVLTAARTAIKPPEPAPTAVKPPAATGPAAPGPVPKVASVSMTAPAGGARPLVTIVGESFGASPGTVRFDGHTIDPGAWTDKQVTFELPNQHPSGAAWSAAAPKAVQVGVAVNNGATSNALPLTVP